MAAAKVDAAQDALEQAQKRAEQAGQHLRAVQLEKSTLQKAMAEAPKEGTQASTGDATKALLPTVRELLARLERPGHSEALDEVVGRLHVMLEEVSPTPPGRLDEALVDELAEAHQGEKRKSAEEVVSDEDDELMGPSNAVTKRRAASETEEVAQHGLWTQLAASPEKSDAEVGAMVRKALRGQRGSPY